MVCSHSTWLHAQRLTALLGSNTSSALPPSIQ